VVSTSTISHLPNWKITELKYEFNIQLQYIWRPILTVVLILLFLKAEEMFVALKESVVEMIQQSSWPDSITKQKALSKASNLRPNVVAPSIFFNQTFLESMAEQVLHHTSIITMLMV
jgi:tRNA pseudouridine-54 N-methylase